MMHKENHQDGKDVLVEEYRESHAFAGYNIFLHRLILLKDIWKTQFLGFMKLKKNDPIIAATNLFRTLSTFIHLKMEMEESVT